MLSETLKALRSSKDLSQKDLSQPENKGGYSA